MRLAASLTALTLLLIGCGQRPDLEVRTFTLQHRDAYEAAQLISPYVYTDRETNPGAISTTRTALSVRETADNLDKIERVLAEFDRPTQAIRLRFQLIEADSFQEADPAIAQITEELRALFRFEGYRLLGEALMSLAGDENNLESRQRFLGPEEIYTVDVEAYEERPGIVRLRHVRLMKEDQDLLLETTASVRAGQTLVVGGARAQVGGRSYILTVTAETG